MPQPGKSGEVDYMQAGNDARGDKGTIGLGETSVVWNDYRGPFGGAAGGPLFNEYRAIGMDDGSVMIVQKDRKVS